MSDWWKDPRLQGPENDYGDYDYLITPIPEDTSEWVKGYEFRCDECGKYTRLARRDTAYFYTLDGYDSMSYTTCWKCEAKTYLYRMKKRILKGGR